MLSERRKILSAIPVFFQEQHALSGPGYECHVGEVFAKHWTRVSVNIDFLMFNMFGCNKFLEIGQLGFGPHLRPLQHTLVDKDQTLRIDLALILCPLRAPAGDVRTVAFAGDDAFF